MAAATDRRRTYKRTSFPSSELPPGSRKTILVGRREILVLNVDGDLFALFNRCPHQQASFETGRIGGTNIPSAVGELEFGMRGRVLMCPWHHYEFDIENGRCLADPKRLRVATYQALHEGDEIAVYT